MSQKIQVRRGNDSSRQSVVFDNGEPVWTTDTNKFYVGDGSTAGGVAIGALLEGESLYSITQGTTEQENGNNLLSAFESAKTATPYGKSLSANNRITIFIPPGIYDLTTGRLIYKSNNNYIDLVGLGSEYDTIVQGYGRNEVVFFSGNLDNNIKNITIKGINSGWGCIPLTYYNQTSQGIKSKLENVILNQSGNAKQQYPDFTAITPKMGGQSDQATSPFSPNDIFPFSECNNIKILGSTSLTGNSNNSYDGATEYYAATTFNNCTISGKVILLGKMYNAPKTEFNNCSFYGSSGMFVPSANALAYAAQFNNCYIQANSNKLCSTLSSSAIDSDGTDYTFNNCRIKTNISGFMGYMNNCIVEPYDTNISTIIINAASQWRSPQILNTIIYAGAGASVAAITGNQTALISNCISNRPITGVTFLLHPTIAGNITGNIRPIL